MKAGQTVSCSRRPHQENLPHPELACRRRLSRYARPSGIFTVMDVPTYRVELDVYSGPLELLLFLIRKNEVDIYDIPIARITSQYLAHVEVIRQIDINLAGDFLVMAATLMEIKSRMLNPQPTADTAGGGVAETVIDPRQALVEQLLQYKRYKDAANHLQRRAHTEQLRFTRAVQKSTGRAPLDIEDLNLFQLIDAFTAIMASVGHSAYGHDVVYDDTPISLHQADILDRVHRDGSITLQELFIGRKSKSEMIGLFLAMLELIRLKKLTFEQTEAAGRILLRPGEAAKPESAGGADTAAAGQDEATAVDDPAADAISHRDVAAPTSEVDTHAEFRPTA